MIQRHRDDAVHVDPERKLVLTVRLAWAILVGIAGIGLFMYRAMEQQSERDRADAAWKATKDEWCSGVNRQLFELGARDSCECGRYFERVPPTVQK